MKFTYSWLKDHLDLPSQTSLEQVVTRLTAIGLEVEAVTDERKDLPSQTSLEQVVV